MKKQNQLFYLYTIIGLSLAALFMPWMKILSTYGLRDVPLTMSGLNGNLSLFNIQINNWFLVAANIYVSVILILKLKKKLSVPDITNKIILILVSLYLLAGLYLALFEAESAHFGLFLIIAAVAANMYFVFKK